MRTFRGYHFKNKMDSLKYLFFFKYLVVKQIPVEVIAGN